MIEFTISGMLPHAGGKGYLLIDATNPAVQYRFAARRVDANGSSVDPPDEDDSYQADLELLATLQRPVTARNLGGQSLEVIRQLWKQVGYDHRTVDRPDTPAGWQRLNEKLDAIEQEAREGVAQRRRWEAASERWQVSVMHSRDLAAADVGPEHQTLLDAVHWLAVILGRSAVLDSATGREIAMSAMARSGQ